MNPTMQTLIEMLKKSQSSPRQSIQQKQQQHLEKIIMYAKNNVPLYKTLYANVDSFDIRALPILTRDMLQSAGNNMVSTHFPKEHGNVYPIKTSGSTGKAVEVLATDFTRLFYDALMLRFHDWHHHDFLKSIMAIRWPKKEARDTHVQLNKDWGHPINKYVPTGHSIIVNITMSSAAQLKAINDYNPEYLHSYPSQLAALAEYSLAHDNPLPDVEIITATGETFCDAYKDKIKAVWPNTKIADIYSAEEVGSIAFQCPYGDHYHVNAEHVYIEIVDSLGQPCKPGETGSVLVTSLLNYATPLIRYNIGDYAEHGDTCDSDIHLPVIHKIVGRKRNRLFLPTGESRFPYLGDRADFLKINKGKTARQFQMVQHTPHDIELKLVVDTPYSSSQEKEYKKLLQKNLGYPFNIAITYHKSISPGARGKFEEFVSLIDQQV